MTTKPKAPKPDIRIIVSAKDTSDREQAFMTFEAHVAYTSPRGLLNPLAGSNRGDGVEHLADLIVTAQIDPSGSSDCLSRWYGYSVEAKPYIVDLRRAKQLVKVLGAIDRKLTTMNERRGYPTDLADFLGRVGEAIGAAKTYPFGRRRQEGEPDMDGSGYKWMNVDWLRDYLNKTVTDWREKHGYSMTTAS